MKLKITKNQITQKYFIAGQSITIFFTGFKEFGSQVALYDGTRHVGYWNDYKAQFAAAFDAAQVEPADKLAV